MFVKMLRHLIFSCILLYSLLISIVVINGTLSPKSKGKNKEKTATVLSGPINHSVNDKNLVVQNIETKDILNNYRTFFQEVDEYNFDGLVLGYVTPWNNHGYDVAKIFGNKFTHISPVWLQIKCTGAKSYEITGTHDVDKQWIADVKNAGKERGLKIVPRILFDGWTFNDFHRLFTDSSEVNPLLSAIIKICNKYKFDGVVLEFWSQIAGSFDKELLIDFVKNAGQYFIKKKLDLILVIPPTVKKFDSQIFENLYDYVTAFSVMSYDFSNPQRPGPNAPIPWVEETIKYLSGSSEKRNKILMGLNFYGNAYTPNGGNPIVGHEYIKLLGNSKTKTLKYDSESVEHFFQTKTDNGLTLVFYPTLYSINERLKLAKKYNTGIAIWELGQGLDYFYDLL